MSRFSWLAKLIAEKTPGPWWSDAVNVEVIVGSSHVIVAKCGSGYADAPQEVTPNADFIAATGTHADKILAVIEAAEASCHNLLEWQAWDGPSGKAPPSQTPYTNALRDALSALAACELAACEKKP